VRHHFLAACAALLACAACVDLTRPQRDAGARDAIVPEAVPGDAGDAGGEAGDAQTPDGGMEDGGPPDAGPDAADAPGSTLGVDLLGYWKLDSNTGATTADSSGLGNDGTILGVPALLTTGLPALQFSDPGAFSFSQVDDAVSSPLTSELRPAAAVSVAAWVRLATPTNRGSCGGVAAQWHFLVFHRNNRGINNGTLEGAALAKMDDGHFAFIMSSNSGVRDVVASTTRPATGIWFHVVGTFDGIQMRIYVGGVAEGMAPHGYPLDYDPTRGWFLGRSGECGGAGEASFDGKLNGALDDVRIYGRALTSREVADLASGAD
jgi:large repetitive protein